MKTIEYIGTAALLGYAGVQSASFIGKAAIPYAMKWFGTIVPGLGTFHKPLAYGGVAAVLQHVTSKAVC